MTEAGGKVRLAKVLAKVEAGGRVRLEKAQAEIGVGGRKDETTGMITAAVHPEAEHGTTMIMRRS